MSVITIPASCAFLDVVAQNWIDQIGVQGKGNITRAENTENRSIPGIILVPGQRAARHLMEAFLRVLDGRASLLPSIMVLGHLDDEALFSLKLDESLPPAVDPIHRLAVLARLILAAPVFQAGLAFKDMSEGENKGAENNMERAWPLAQALADLLDEAYRNGVDLAEGLPLAVEEEFAHHWEQTLTFLQIVTQYWPQWLAEEELGDPVARQMALLEAQARAWQDSPPQGPVWAVGFVDGSAGIAKILKSVQALPQGKVILQGVDRVLDDALWQNLPETHPQALFKELLDILEVERQTLMEWGKPDYPGREEFFRSVFLPEEGLPLWGRSHMSPDYGAIYQIFAEDQQKEAQAIALALRNVAEHKGKMAALVTPDRALAQRVRAELLRLGIYADDSAGEPLQRTPAAVFLRLIAQAWKNDFSPVTLLSVLKHPLAALGFTVQEARSLARILEVAILRGPAPPPGLAALRQSLNAAWQKDSGSGNSGSGDSGSGNSGLKGRKAHYGKNCDEETWQKLMLFMARLEEAFAPLQSMQGREPLSDMIEALIRTAEALATTSEELAESTMSDSISPGMRLWRGEDGAMLSQHLASLIIYLQNVPGGLPEQPCSVLENFLGLSMAGKALTGLRGHQDGKILAHPRISILGVLEARLLSFDTVILGGLNEGVWPPSTDSGPWLSRPMRRIVGLPSPERQIGASAHDFLTLSSCAGTVIFSNSKRRDGSPVVPARWLVRLAAFLAGQKAGRQSLEKHCALFWQERFDLPEGEARPVSPPEPRPPVALRPRRLSITQIDTLKTDPYAIYARLVLRLSVLPPLEQGVEHADYGNIVHKAMEQMLQTYPLAWPHNAEEILLACFKSALEDETTPVRPALKAWWWPRLMRLAQWVVVQEAERMNGSAAWKSHTEIKAEYVFPDLPGGAFVIGGRADRIDLAVKNRGNMVETRVFDYKTGTVPSVKDVQNGWSSQIVLTAALLEHGGFSPLRTEIGQNTAKVVEMLYWRMSGGAEIGKVVSMPSVRIRDEGKRRAELEAMVAEVLPKLRSLLEEYERQVQPYRSQPWAGREQRYADYDQLARVDEWRNSTSDAF